MIRKIIFSLPVVLSFFISFSTFSKVVVTKGESFDDYYFKVDNLKLTSVTLNNKSFNRVKLDGVEGFDGIMYQKGFPEIPVIRIMVDVDDNSDIEINFSKNKAQSFFKSKISIVPSQESIPKIKGSKASFYQNLSAYKINSIFPLKDYEIKNVGSIKGVSRKLITLYPFKYNPLSSSYNLIDEFQVRVHKSVNKEVDENIQEMFVFVVGSEFKNNLKLEQYMDFKRSIGYATRVLVVGEDVKTDDDIRSKLKEFLQNEKYNLKYAILIGDLEHVPSHKGRYINGVTDHYYRAIDTNDYLDDLNGPDIGVGRLTVKNNSELDIVVDKFLKYQMGNFKSEDWLGRVSFIATNDRWQIAEGSHNFAINSYMNDFGYKGHFPQENMGGGDQLYAITHKVSDKQVVDSMGQGRAIINYSGHGGRDSWAGPRVSQRNVRDMSHPDAIPFVVSNACITGDFRRSEAFAETWLKAPSGAILFWGSMDSSYWDEDDILERNMYHAIYRDNKWDFSSITQYALSEVYRHWGGENRSNYYWETYVVFGDPSINLRKWYTKNLTVKAPPAIIIGQDSIKISLFDDENKPVSNLKVGLKIEGKTISDFGHTNIRGEIILNLEEVEVLDQVIITAYGQNFKTKVINLKVENTDKPYLVVKDFLVSGNDNLAVSPFENAALTFSIKNVSLAKTAGGQLEITDLIGPANLDYPVLNIPSLESNEIFKYSGNSFGFSVNDGKNGDKIKASFKWSTVEGQSFVFQKVFVIKKAEIEFDLSDYGDVEDVTMWSLGPGESGDVFFNLTNNGANVLKNGRFSWFKYMCIFNKWEDYC